MFIFKRVPHQQDWRTKQKEEKASVGFVPTMGALHAGHISLVLASRKECAQTAVSIFVNPLQFNDPDDLKRYPRPIEADIEKVYDAGADVLFLPGTEDIYPAQDQHELQFDPGVLGDVMEGKFRPGHFKGVAEVVYRLLRMIEPDKLYLGQKDFQQVAIIRQLISDQQLPVEVVVCPTLREANGLAMSSRNIRLSVKGREEAGLIYQTLQAGKNKFNQGIQPGKIAEEAMALFRARHMDPEYFEIVDGHTLQPIQEGTAAKFVVACTAVKVEGIRLIDNLKWKDV